MGQPKDLKYIIDESSVTGCVPGPGHTCFYLILSMALRQTDCSHFTEEQTEAWREWVTCLRSPNLKEADPGFALNLSGRIGVVLFYICSWTYCLALGDPIRLAD